MLVLKVPLTGSLRNQDIFGCLTSQPKWSSLAHKSTSQKKRRLPWKNSKADKKMLLRNTWLPAISAFTNWFNWFWPTWKREIERRSSRSSPWMCTVVMSSKSWLMTKQKDLPLSCGNNSFDSIGRNQPSMWMLRFWISPPNTFTNGSATQAVWSSRP